MNASELFSSINEPYAEGLFEREGAAPTIRYANALKRYWEKAPIPEYKGGLLYPSGINPFNYDRSITVRPHYSNTFEFNQNGLKSKSEEAYSVMRKEWLRVANFHGYPHTVGGMGWTHSFPNYSRILSEGLDSYKARVEEMPNGDFKEGLKIVLEGIDIYHERCLDALVKGNAPDSLVDALKIMPYKPAKTLYEAFVSYNFIFYVDGCDDVGPLDKIFEPYYAGEDLVPILREFFASVDCNDAWSGTLGPNYNEITKACLIAIRNGRRPNLQLLVTKDMPDWMWEYVGESLKTSCGQPALYNDRLYKQTLRDFMPDIPEEDIQRIAFGGCTETMIEGKSNVGSDDAGMNFALIFSQYMRENLTKCDTFKQFFDGLIDAINLSVAKTLDILNEYRRTRALYRPSMVRSLFIDDCIGANVEYNAGGAQYCWSVINNAGLINVIDSLSVIKTLVFDQKRYEKAEFLALLDARDPELLALADKCPKYGRDDDRADQIGVDLAEKIMDSYNQRECFPRGKFYPVANQFTTYVAAGKGIPATPDGRAAGDPLCDSLGAINGNDTKGPTAMLNSVSKLPLYRIIGTPTTNIRISKEHLSLTLKPLVEAFFARGGMQLQVSCLSREEILDAMEHPEKHRSLVVRVGGYSEYFNRLSPELKMTVLNRTEH